MKILYDFSDFDQDLSSSCKKLRFKHHHGIEIRIENGFLCKNAMKGACNGPVEVIARFPFCFK